VRAAIVLDRHPTLAYLPMNAPEAPIRLSAACTTWKAAPGAGCPASAVVLLKSPAQPLPIEAVFTIPDPAPARHVELLLDGRVVASETYGAPGAYTLKSAAAIARRTETATVTLTLDRTFSVPGDHRELGVVVSAVGFHE
jgi:hypothetical protein